LAQGDARFVVQRAIIERPTLIGDLDRSILPGNCPDRRWVDLRTCLGFLPRDEGRPRLGARVDAIAFARIVAPLWAVARVDVKGEAGIVRNISAKLGAGRRRKLGGWDGLSKAWDGSQRDGASRDDQD